MIHYLIQCQELAGIGFGNMQCIHKFKTPQFYIPDDDQKGDSKKWLKQRNWMGEMR